MSHSPVACLLLILMSTSLHGRTFVVNTETDKADISPGDGVCNSSSSDPFECSLRAAIDEANSLEGVDTIRFIGQLLTVRLTLGPLELIDNGTCLFGNGPSTRIDGVAGNYRESVFELRSDSNRISGLQIERAHGDGVLITGSFNMIGGDSLTQRVILAGNGLDDSLASAIRISGLTARFNRVRGSYIGLANDGTTVRKNKNGVTIENGASENAVDGSYGQTGNLISGNEGYGIRITSGAFDNTVCGATVGLDLTGEVPAGNRLGGILVSSTAHDNRIGGNTQSDRNLISGNGNTGITIRGDATKANLIVGNWIGPDKSGRLSLGNLGAGIVISDGASDNIIGQTGQSGGNVVSGNRRDGIVLSGDNVRGNMLVNNLIGAEPRGFGSLPNGIDSGNGVSILHGAHDNLIGGDTLSEGNLISGNVYSGLLLSGTGTTGNIVTGNFIGVNIAGSSSLINGSGIVIRGGANRNRIGGRTAGERNIISGNRGQPFPFGAGVAILDRGSDDNVVMGNFIGTDFTGTRALRNGGPGVMISLGASHNQIGGVTRQEMNLISGNGSGPLATGRAGGVHISGEMTRNNRIIGNYIGVAFSGNKGLENRGPGVGIYSGASGNKIGGQSMSHGNIIAFNNGHGILIDGIQSRGNLIRYNSTFDNDSLGVALRGGSQDKLTPPLLISALAGEVSGTGAPPLGQIDLYTAAPDPSGEGEGRLLIASGFADITGSFSIMHWEITNGDVITAIATDGNDNSSAFALNTVVGVITDVDDENSPLLPNTVRLGQNYPNPFNPTTTIEFDLPVSNEIELSVYNLLGQRVRLLAKGLWPAGRHKLEWQGVGNEGKAVASGIYYYRLSARDVHLTKKMILLK